MGIYNPEQNLRTHILKHFHAHPKSIEHIIKDYHSNTHLNHALVSSLKEKILLNLRKYPVWDRFEDTEIERLIDLELHNHIGRTMSVDQKQNFNSQPKHSQFPNRYVGSAFLIFSLLIYTIYQGVKKDFFPSIYSVQYIKGVIEPSDGLLLLLLGTVCLLIAGPPLERLYGSAKFLYLFLLPGCVVFPFQNGTIIELLCGSLCGLFGVHLGLTWLRKGRVDLKKTWKLWVAYSIYLIIYYYLLGPLFNPFPLITATIIGLFFSLWIKSRVYRVK